MKNLKNNYKLIIGICILIIVGLLCFFIYKNLFYENESNRLEGIEKYEITQDEIKAAKDKLTEIEEVKSVDIYANYKIIKIMLELKEDVDFKTIDKLSNEAIGCFTEKNLSYYDVEIFVDSLNTESEIYPKIGYKNKKNSKFTWNR